MRVNGNKEDKRKEWKNWVINARNVLEEEEESSPVPDFQTVSLIL